MRDNVTLTIASVLAILLMTLHLADDFANHGGTTAIGFTIVVLILVVWLYGTLVLGGRRSGLAIVALGSLLALVIPAFHIWAAHGIVDARFAGTSVPYFFVWTLMALSVTALLSLTLSLRGLWRSFRP